MEKLQLANNFINRAEFAPSQHYHDGSNFRASPMAFLIQGSGDSEDFSIAKYITLREMGNDSSKLRLTYAQLQPNSASHMILAYYAKTDAEPLVLDYLDKSIQQASDREDIRPIYSFKLEDIWVIHSAIRMQINLQLEGSFGASLNSTTDTSLGDNPESLLNPSEQQYQFWHDLVSTMNSTHY
jgi:hypothetical protein